MKKYYFFLLLSIIFELSSAQNFGSFASAIYLEVGGTSQFYNLTGDGIHQIGKLPFSGNFGVYSPNSGALKIKGAEFKSWKNWGANVCSINNTLNYAIYPTGLRPSPYPTFKKINLTFKASCVAGLFTDGFGGCSGSDQKWGNIGESIDITSLTPGNYTLEVFIEYWGSDYNSGGCETRRVISMVGKGYTAEFSIMDKTVVGYLDFDYEPSGNQIQRKFVIDVMDISPLSDSSTSSVTDLLENKIRIYPNPTSGVVKMDWANELIGQVTAVQVQNHTAFYSQNFTISSSQKELSFDLTTQPAGIYYVNFLLSDGSKISKTLIKN